MFIAVLLCRGVFCQKMDLKSMWSEKYGLPIKRALCSRNTFTKIMRFIRCDNKSERNRTSSDKFTMVREIWERFINNSQSSLIPSKYLTIDEQLLTCKTRCSFIQYMPDKPEKFGLKFWLLCEAESKYVCNGFPYLGKIEERDSNDLLGEFVIKRLMEPYKNKGYCVTSDNFFSSHKVAKELLQIKTTFIGTIKKNKREIPPIAKTDQHLHETIFLDDEKGAFLTVYQCKPKKNVIVLSTEHGQAIIPQLDFNVKKKPNTILTDNPKKVGVDSVDQMSRQYSLKAPTRRWPVCVFNNILNMTIINSWVIYRRINGLDISRRNFIIKIIEEIFDHVS